MAVIGTGAEICTSTTRPSTITAGTIIYETDTKNYQIYNGSTWISLANAATFSATGGTVTTSGSYTIHRFTASGDFIIAGGQTKLCDLLIVGGGGSGGGTHSGGGGGGEVVYRTNILLVPGTYKVVVGNGASFGGTQGESSWFQDIRALGGGCAGDSFPGGGGGPGSAGAFHINGTRGGTGYTSPWRGGGGAGAGTGGSDGNNAKSGGDGIANSITGSSVYYAAGGGGGRDGNYTTGSTGGTGGGGTGASGSTAATAGTANTGSGGGGGGFNSYTAGAAGGSGVVIVRYLT